MNIKDAIFEASLIEIEVDAQHKFMTCLLENLKGDNPEVAARHFVNNSIKMMIEHSLHNRRMGNTSTSNYFRRLANYYKKVAKECGIDLS